MGPIDTELHERAMHLIWMLFNGMPVINNKFNPYRIGAKP